MATKKKGGSVPEMMNEGQKNMLEWLKSNPPTAEIIEELPTLRGLAGLNVGGDAGFERDHETGFHKGVILQGFDLLPPDVQELFKKTQAATEYLYNFAVEQTAQEMTTKDSGNSYINNNPVVKSLVKRERGDVFLGADPETGEALIFTLYDGFLDPLEADILECILKFKVDGQTTKSGKTCCTLSQLYREQRQGAGTTRPTKEQRDTLLQQLKEMAREERKVDWGLSSPVQLARMFPELAGIDQETERVRLRLVSFDEFYGKINGKKDWLLVFDDTPFMNRFAEMLRTYEPVPKELKAIKYIRYDLQYKKGGKIASKSFTSNEERRDFCKRRGIKGDDIVTHDDVLTTYYMTDQRIAIRYTIFLFVFSYLRARTAGKNHSPKLPYATIWERCHCNVNTSQQLKQNKDIVRIIFNHLERCGLIKWKEYYNVGSKKADGVEISIPKALKEGGA